MDVSSVQAAASSINITIMSNYSHFLGIDISKKTLDYALFDAELVLVEQGQISNNQSAIGRLRKKLREQHSLQWGHVLICAEYTGVYSIPLIKSAAKHDLLLWLENPLQVKRSLGITRGKSDPIDARRLAEYATRFRDKAQFHAKILLEMLPLREMINFRESLVKARKSLANHPAELKAMAPEVAALLKSAKEKALATIDEQIAELTARIQAFIAANHEWARNSSLIQSVPGIGPITAATFILLTWNFTRLCDPKKLASFSCMAPFSYHSGTSLSSKPGVSKMGEKRLKSLLQLSVFNAIKSDHQLNLYYERKVAEGKAKLLVANNIKNKLISRVLAVVKRQEPYTISKAPLTSIIAPVTS